MWGAKVRFRVMVMVMVMVRLMVMLRFRFRFRGHGGGLLRGKFIFLRTSGSTFSFVYGQTVFLVSGHSIHCTGTWGTSWTNPNWSQVTPFIAEARGVLPGVDCNSPPAHSAFKDAHGFVQFIRFL